MLLSNHNIDNTENDDEADKTEMFDEIDGLNLGYDVLKVKFIKFPPLWYQIHEDSVGKS